MRKISGEICEEICEETGRVRLFFWGRKMERELKESPSNCFSGEENNGKKINL